MNWIKLFFFLIVTSSVVLLGCDSPSKAKNEDPSEEENPTEEYTPQPTVTENVIIVTLDGVRWQEVFKGADSTLIHNIGYINGDFEQVKENYWVKSEKERRKKLMPFFWNELVQQGQLYGNREYGNFVNVTNNSLKSFPGYCEIWNGYADPSILTNNHPNNPHTTVLEFLNKQEGFEGDNVVITVAASSLERIFNVDENDFTFSAGHKDSTVYNKTMRALKNDHPRVVYMSINKTDHWAHQFQYNTYLNLIHEADSFIQTIWEYIRQDEFYKDRTTLLVTTDHGRGVGSEWHTHGSGGVAHADETWFAVVGPDTTPTGEQKEEMQVEATQFAKTIAAFLEFNFNTGSAVGELIESVFDK